MPLIMIKLASLVTNPTLQHLVILSTKYKIESLIANKKLNLLWLPKKKKETNNNNNKEDTKIIGFNC